MAALQRVVYDSGDEWTNSGEFRLHQNCVDGVQDTSGRLCFPEDILNLQLRDCIKAAEWLSCPRLDFRSRGRWSSRAGEERADGVDFPPEISDVLFALFLCCS